MRRAVAVVSILALPVLVPPAAGGQPLDACGRDDRPCLRELSASECTRADSTLQQCLVFLQRLETTRRGSSSTALLLTLGETLHELARKDVPAEAKRRYLERSRAAYGEAVRRRPLDASGYLGLAELTVGEERVAWLRGAVRAEYHPAHMELLAEALSVEIGGHVGELEAARVIEDAYTFAATNGERWRYGASALQRYTVAVDRYPSATSARALESVLLRITDDIDYALLQRALLEPEAHLATLADAFAVLCEKSIAQIVSLEECMAGLELAVFSAERSTSPGVRRRLAEAALMGMRTIAGESLPRAPEARVRFPSWLDRLVAADPEPVEVSVDLLEARADYTADSWERASVLLNAIELSRNRGDLRLKLGATYVDLELWGDALEQLRVAAFFLPAEEHEHLNRLVETADTAYQAQFWPPDAHE